MTKPLDDKALQFLCDVIDAFLVCAFLCISQRHTRKKHTGTETQRHRNTKTQRHRDTTTQRHRGTEAQKHRDTKTQRHKDTSTSGLCIACCEMFMYKSFFMFSKRIVAPATAMVDNRCPVRLQTQLTGEEERDELEV